jgi:hypothetical protein
MTKRVLSEDRMTQLMEMKVRLLSLLKTVLRVTFIGFSLRTKTLVAYKVARF